MPSLRICLVSAAYRPYPSGVSEHVHGLATGLSNLGQDVTILTTRFPWFEPERSDLRVVRLGRAVLIPMNRSYATLPVGLGLAGQVRRFLDESRFDIVHCHGVFWPEISYWAIRYSRATNVFTNLTAGFRTGATGAGLFRLLFSGHVGRIHGHIAISQRSRSAVEAYVPGDYRIIPCGVDLTRFRPGARKLRLGSSDRPVILFVGRFDKRKGLDLLLEAMPRILASVPDVRLLIVGGGPMEAQVRGFVVKAGLGDSVSFAGRVSPEDLPEYYSSCDVYCSPATGGETFGIVLLEAMASGTTVVASNIPGYDEVVRHGTDGLLFPPGDKEALSDAIVQVLMDRELRRRLADAGLEKSRQYSWFNVARKTLDYYHELLSVRSARAAVSS